MKAFVGLGYALRIEAEVGLYLLVMWRVLA